MYNQNCIPPLGLSYPHFNFLNKSDITCDLTITILQNAYSILFMLAVDCNRFELGYIQIYNGIEYYVENFILYILEFKNTNNNNNM